MLLALLRPDKLLLALESLAARRERLLDLLDPDLFFLIRDSDRKAVRAAVRLLDDERLRLEERLLRAEPL